MSSGAGDHRTGRSAGRCAGGDRRGFTLVEALVALVVAALVLPALARAFGGAWAASRAPMDVASAILLARDVAEGADVPADARTRGFSAERAGGPATVLVLPSRVAPAPRGTGPGKTGADAADLHPEATPAGFKLAPPKGLGDPAAAAPPPVQLRRVTVAVRTPAGRRVTLETVRMVDVSR